MISSIHFGHRPVHPAKFGESERRRAQRFTRRSSATSLCPPSARALTATDFASPSSTTRLLVNSHLFPLSRTESRGKNRRCTQRPANAMIFAGRTGPVLSPVDSSLSPSLSYSAGLLQALRPEEGDGLFFPLSGNISGAQGSQNR